jgi:hypothetical protein
LYGRSRSGVCRLIDFQGLSALPPVTQAFIERVHTRNILLPRSKSGERKTVLDMLFSQSW